MGRPIERLRVEIEAAFPQINGEISELYAGRESRRSSLRTIIPLTFDSQFTVPVIPSTGPVVFFNNTTKLPDQVIRRYMKDSRVIVTPNPGDPPISMSWTEPWGNILGDLDPRLGYWANNDNAIYARLPKASTIVAPFTAQFSCISAPGLPTSVTGPNVNYACPPDMLPEIIHAGITFLMGSTERPTTELA